MAGRLRYVRELKPGELCVIPPHAVNKWNDQELFGFDKGDFVLFIEDDIEPDRYVFLTRKGLIRMTGDTLLCK